MISIINLSIFLGTFISISFFSYDVWKTKSQRLRDSRNLPRLSELIIPKVDFLDKKN